MPVSPSKNHFSDLTRFPRNQNSLQCPESTRRYPRKKIGKWFELSEISIGKLCYTLWMKFLFAGLNIWMIEMIALSLCGFFAALMVVQIIKSACGMPAKASKRTLKQAWKRQETPDSGVAENSAISIGFLHF